MIPKHVKFSLELIFGRKESYPQNTVLSGKPFSKLMEGIYGDHCINSWFSSKIMGVSLTA